MSRALGGVASGTYIFCLPGSTGACHTGWDEIIAPSSTTVTARAIWSS